MTNIITGVIAIAIFLAFVLGLGVSIGTIPFGIIVIIVSCMLLVDFYQSTKERLKENKK